MQSRPIHPSSPKSSDTIRSIFSWRSRIDHDHSNDADLCDTRELHLASSPDVLLIKAPVHHECRESIPEQREKSRTVLDFLVDSRSLSLRSQVHLSSAIISTRLDVLAFPPQSTSSGQEKRIRSHFIAQDHIKWLIFTVADNQAPRPPVACGLEKTSKGLKIYWCDHAGSSRPDQIVSSNDCLTSYQGLLTDAD